jgi:hypothetical protein
LASVAAAPTTWSGDSFVYISLAARPRRAGRLPEQCRFVSYKLETITATGAHIYKPYKSIQVEQVKIYH